MSDFFSKPAIEHAAGKHGTEGNPSLPFYFQCSDFPSPLPRRCRASRAFTLIELLVVISIIATLAAITLSVLPGVAQWKGRQATEAQLRLLQSAIDDYKETKGFYPPSVPVTPSTNLLYYELSGVTTNGNGFTVFNEPLDTITSNSVLSFYGGTVATIFNVLGLDDPNITDPNKWFDPDYPGSTRGFHADLNKIQKKAADGVLLLAVPARGPGEADFNTWNYLAPGVHNPDSYDLWADIQIGKKQMRISNWKE